MNNAVEAKRIAQAKINLTFRQPFFGTLLLYLKFVEVDETSQFDTMAVNGRSLWWNPFFTAQLSGPEIEGVLAHEAAHCALLHMTRRGDRFFKRWNQAADFAINRDLLEGKFTLPKSWKDRAGNVCVPCIADDGRYDGMTAEQIYDALQSSGSNGGGSGKGMPGGNGDPGQGDPSDMGGIVEVDATSVEGRELAGDWQIRVRQAIAQASKRAGHIPGSVIALIDELNAPKIDWRAKMRQFVGSSLSNDTTWQRPSRRLISSGVYAPSRERNAVDKILFLIDRSGSQCSAEQLRASLSEAQGMLDEGAISRIQWAALDTRIADTGEVGLGETFIGVEMKGGGGTDFRQPMEWAAEQEDVACIVFWTDGQTNSWGDYPGKPVLIIGAEIDADYLNACPYASDVCLVTL